MSDFDFKNVSDSLYSSFIARDFFAKVLPGSIVLAAIALSFLNYDTLTQKVKDLRFSETTLRKVAPVGAVEGKGLSGYCHDHDFR